MPKVEKYSTKKTGYVLFGLSNWLFICDKGHEIVQVLHVLKTGKLNSFIICNLQPIEVEDDLYEFSDDEETILDPPGDGAINDPVEGDTGNNEEQDTCRFEIVTHETVCFTNQAFEEI